MEASVTEAGFAAVNGARLYYEVAGAGEPVVLVHGFSLDTRMWDDQWAALATRFRVLRYDARGFGRSSLPDGPYSHSADLDALLRHTGLQRPHVVGLSMGGGIAIDYAISWPENVRSLTLIDAVVGGYTAWSDGFRRGVSYSDVARRDGLEVAREAWLSHGFFDAARERPAVAARLRQIVADYSGWHWLNQDPALPLQPPAIERLAEVSAPTLVIVGERDVEDFRLIAALVASNVAGARQVTIAGAGHMANMEAPGEVNALLLDFLSKCGA